MATVLCSCVDADNRPRRDCDLGCGGTGVLCSRCLDKPGRWRDDICPDCGDGTYQPADLDAPPNPEHLRLARELEVLMAANHGG